MEFLRKSIKAYITAAFVFIMLSFLLACIICFSGFKESWAFAGLIFILSADAMLLGIMQGAAAGRRGLLTGMLSAMILLVMVISAAGGVFAEDSDLKSKAVFYMIPVLAGGLGGITGAGRCNG